MGPRGGLQVPATGPILGSSFPRGQQERLCLVTQDRVLCDRMWSWERHPTWHIPLARSEPQVLPTLEGRGRYRLQPRAGGGGSVSELPGTGASSCLLYTPSISVENRNKDFIYKRVGGPLAGRGPNALLPPPTYLGGFRVCTKLICFSPGIYLRAERPHGKHRSGICPAPSPRPIIIPVFLRTQ